MALTSVANFKTWAAIGVTDYDTELTPILAEAEAFVAKVLERRLEDTGSDLTEYYDGRGDSVLYLQGWPVTSVTSVSYLSSVASGAASYTAFDATEYYTTADGRLIRANVLDAGFPDANADAYSVNWPCGHANIKVVYKGGYSSSTVTADILAAVYRVMSELLASRRGTKPEPTEEDLRGIVLEAAGGHRRGTP